MIRIDGTERLWVCKRDKTVWALKAQNLHWESKNLFNKCARNLQKGNLASLQCLNDGCKSTQQVMEAGHSIPWSIKKSRSRPWFLRTYCLFIGRPGTLSSSCRGPRQWYAGAVSPIRQEWCTLLGPQETSKLSTTRNRSHVPAWANRHQLALLGSLSSKERETLDKSCHAATGPGRLYVICPTLSVSSRLRPRLCENWCHVGFSCRTHLGRICPCHAKIIDPERKITTMSNAYVEDSVVLPTWQQPRMSVKRSREDARRRFKEAQLRRPLTWSASKWVNGLVEKHAWLSAGMVWNLWILEVADNGWSIKLKSNMKSIPHQLLSWLPPHIPSHDSVSINAFWLRRAELPRCLHHAWQADSMLCQANDATLLGPVLRWAPRQRLGCPAPKPGTLLSHSARGQRMRKPLGPWLILDVMLQGLYTRRHVPVQDHRTYRADWTKHVPRWPDTSWWSACPGQRTAPGWCRSTRHWTFGLRALAGCSLRIRTVYPDLPIAKTRAGQMQSFWPAPWLHLVQLDKGMVLVAAQFQ